MTLPDTSSPFRNIRKAALPVALVLLLSACNKDDESETAIVVRPSEADAMEVLKRRQAADGDEVLSAELEPVRDGRFEGIVQIKSKNGAVKNWTCNIRPSQTDHPLGGYSCYLARQ